MAKCSRDSELSNDIQYSIQLPQNQSQNFVTKNLPGKKTNTNSGSLTFTSLLHLISPFLGILRPAAPRSVIWRHRRLPAVRLLCQPVLYYSLFVTHSRCYADPDLLFNCNFSRDGCSRIVVC
jgi:hypothetical protein